MFKAGSLLNLKISKPSGSEAQELARLFPQSTHNGKRILLMPTNHLNGWLTERRRNVEARYLAKLANWPFAGYLV